MDNKELIAALTERAGTYGALRKSALTPILLDRAAQAIAAQDARIAELEAALVQSAIPMEALLIAETSFPFLAPSIITRLEVALRSINKLCQLNTFAGGVKYMRVY